MNDKLLIIYSGRGYDIIMEDGTPMEFCEKEPTSGIISQKEAMSICQRHGYFFTNDNGYSIEMTYKHSVNEDGL